MRLVETVPVFYRVSLFKSSCVCGGVLRPCLRFMSGVGSWVGLTELATLSVRAEGVPIGSTSGSTMSWELRV